MLTNQNLCTFQISVNLLVGSLKVVSLNSFSFYCL